MNLPNKITVFRIFLAPVWLAVFLIDIPYRWLVSACVFALAAATDAIDGRIARKNNIVTVFGKFLDPIADKMLVTAGLLAFLKEGLCNIWIVFIILVREFIITSLRLIASSQGVVIPANIFGKIKTVMQMVGIIMTLAFEGFIALFPQLTVLCTLLRALYNVALWLSALMTVISGINYLVNNKTFVDPNK